MCADLNARRLKAIRETFTGTKTTTDYRDILDNKDIHVVCIASPTDTHFAFAKEALEHDKHVLCEKPLALTADECEVLAGLAAGRKRTLMVGHVFLFNAGIMKLRDYIRSGELGRIHYAHSTRTNLGPFRYDVNALWDLAPHDISIFNYLFDGCPVNVSARGQKCLGTERDDLAFGTLEYPGNTVAHVHVSWIDPKKVRQITVVGEKKMVTWDDLDDVGPIKLYDKHVEKSGAYYLTYGEFRLLSKDGGITIPKVELSEPLKVQDQYFIDCVERNSPAELSDARKGRDVVRTLVALQQSIDRRGACVEL
jgi:predicted dehydrogenase